MRARTNNRLLHYLIGGELARPQEKPTANLLTRDNKLSFHFYQALAVPRFRARFHGSGDTSLISSFFPVFEVLKFRWLSFPDFPSLLAGRNPFWPKGLPRHACFLRRGEMDRSMG